MPATTTVRSTEKTEQLKVKYAHREAMFRMGIVAIIVVGALVCMAHHIPGGEKTILAAIGLLAAYKTKDSHTIKSKPDK
jgi:hypothetical protein